MYYYLTKDGGFNSPNDKKLVNRLKSLINFFAINKKKNLLQKPYYWLEISERQLTKKEIENLVDKPLRKNTKLVCVFSDALLHANKENIITDFIENKFSVVMHIPNNL